MLLYVFLSSSSLSSFQPVFVRWSPCHSKHSHIVPPRSIDVPLLCSYLNVNLELSLFFPNAYATQLYGLPAECADAGWNDKFFTGVLLYF